MDSEVDNTHATAPANRIHLGSMAMPVEGNDASSPQYHSVLPADAHRYVVGVLRGYGVPLENANIVARCLVAADLRGVDTHGVNRIPSYVARIRSGVLDAAAQPTLSEITPVVAQVDAHNAFGFVAAHMGMSKAIDMARVYGIGMVSVKHSNHFGMSAWLVQEAIDQGMMSLVFTNSSPALVRITCAWLIGTSRHQLTILGAS